MLYDAQSVILCDHVDDFLFIFAWFVKSELSCCWLGG